MSKAIATISCQGQVTNDTVRKVRQWLDEHKELTPVVNDVWTHRSTGTPDQAVKRIKEIIGDALVLYDVPFEHVQWEVGVVHTDGVVSDDV